MDCLKNFLKGVLMGMVDIIPGVSGGTIAFITGVYERLVRNLSMFHPKNFKEIEFKFLIAIGLGVSVGIAIMSKILKFLLENSPDFTYAFFLGLICGSAFFLMVNMKKDRRFCYVIPGAMLSLLIVEINVLSISNSALSLFISGFLATCAMTLPGISGAMVLVILGQYEYLLHLIAELRFFELLIFASGAVLSLLTFVKFLNYLISNHRMSLFPFLVGMIMGGASAIYNKISMDSVYVPVFFSLGFIASYVLYRFQ